MKKSTQPYQYKSDDGKMFLTGTDKEYYQEQQMEKRQQLQEEKYRDDMDKVPNWNMLQDEEDWKC
jgi:hypothetical protein